MKFSENHKFIESLKADPILENYQRQVKNAFFSFVAPKSTKSPKLLHVSTDMMAELGISKEYIKRPEFLKIITGNSIAKNSKPYSMVYAGHQFGNWAGQLGDGRAINLGEVENKEKSWVVQLKGAGETPYSRTADGLAVLRSSIREYLCSEAMHHLGVPTTRAFSLALTGDMVMRDILYDGNPKLELGAIVSRVSPSFLRFGNFELFAWHKDVDNLKLLADFTINNHFKSINAKDENKYIKMFAEISDLTLNMIIHWQRVGFVHGVMNTDNMSILGLTIDYGPYGWLEGYDPNWTPNTTDSQNRRYRFGNQPNIALWNLYKLANALYPLVGEVEPLQEILDKYNSQFSLGYYQMMRSKLGLESEMVEDQTLIDTLQENLQLTETDMTIFFRNLALFKKAEPNSGLDVIAQAFYEDNEVQGAIEEKWINWFQSYSSRLKKNPISDEVRAKQMNKVNPKYVLRNYMAQMAIDEAEKGNYGIIDELFKLLRSPYKEQAENEKWFAKRPEWARNKVGCSMLSCSS